MGWLAGLSHVRSFKIPPLTNSDVGLLLSGSYAASKAAVSNLTRQVAVDYGEFKIHCNAICPGCR